MKTFTRDLGFANFNEEDMQWVKVDGVIVYEAWKNLTANGVPPLTLLKCKGVDLVDYKIYGNSVQDGTPTPETPVVIENLGNGVLPSEYRQVEYIESNGTQYIDTGLIGKTGYTIETNVAFTELATESYQYFAGYSYTGSADRTYYIRLNNTTTDLGYTYGSDNSNTYKLATLKENTFYNIKSVMKPNKQQMFLDGKSIGSTTFGELPYDEENPKYIYMFISQYVSGTNGGCKSKCKEAKWYDENDNLVRHFIPCYRKSDNVVGMYDLVENKFYENAGTGVFEKGEDVDVQECTIPVKVSGKNLLDISKMENGTIRGTTGEGYYATNRVRTDYIYVTAGTYCFSTVGTPQDVQFGGCHKYSSKDETTWLGMVSGQFIYNGNRNYYTVKINKACYIRLPIAPTSTSSITNLSIDNIANYKPQVEMGDLTEYESYIEQTTNIYLKEPLRKIGDYEDYIDFKNKKVIRKIYREFIDKVEFISSDVTPYMKFLSNITHKPYIFYKTSGYIPSSIGYAISNKFKQNKDAYTNQGSYPSLIQSYRTTAGVSRISYTFDDSSINTIAEAQAKIGNGFYVYYVLDTPIEETIELPNIPTIKGTTILSVDTTIQPSSMEVVYKGKR